MFVFKASFSVLALCCPDIRECVIIKCQRNMLMFKWCLSLIVIRMGGWYMLSNHVLDLCFVWMLCYCKCCRVFTRGLVSKLWCCGGDVKHKILDLSTELTR